MLKLNHPYVSVVSAVRNSPSYGGNQSWTDIKHLKKYGCGLVAGTDLMLYLHQTRADCRSPLFELVPEGEVLSEELYLRLLQTVNRKYLPVIPFFGMNGFMLSGGLNLYFRHSKIKLRAGWRIFSFGLWETMGRMLEEDIPVIFSIGANFPMMWRGQKLKLYVRRGDSYVSTAAVNAHYVTVTGMDDRWLAVSTWGKKYYINREEFTRYVRKYSCYLFSNLVEIRTR